MSLKVAEFFVGLGIKGNQKVKEALGGVHSALKEARDTSKEMKLGIAGAVFALEEITRRSVLAAIDLKNFAGATGLSTQELQKWAYWSEMNDVKGESLTTTIKGLQSAQSALRLGQGVPAGAVYFGLNQNNNPIEMMGEIQKKLRQIGADQKEIGNARTMAATLGISDDMFAALRIGTVGFAGFRKEMNLTGKEINKLVGLGHAWNEFWLVLKGTTNKTIANDLAGPITGFVHTFRNATLEFAELSTEFNKALGKLNPSEMTAFKTSLAGLAAVFTAALIPMGPWIVALVAVAAALDQIYKLSHGQDSLATTIVGNAKKGFAEGGTVADWTKGHTAGSPEADKENQRILDRANSLNLGGLKPAGEVGGGGDIHVNVHSTSHISGADNPEETAHVLGDAIANAVIQNPALNSYLNNSRGRQ